MGIDYTLVLVSVLIINHVPDIIAFFALVVLACGVQELVVAAVERRGQGSSHD